MDNKRRKYIRAWDLLIIGAVILITAISMLLLFSRGESKIAVIKCSGKTFRTISLSELTENESITVHGENHIDIIVELDKDGVSAISSDCPDKLCVNTGKITTPGQSIVCLPARVSISLEGDIDDDYVDTVVK